MGYLFRNCKTCRPALKCRWKSSCPCSAFPKPPFIAGKPKENSTLRNPIALSKAIEVLESAENARQWLASPQVGLGGAVPLEYAETELGAREVEDLLGRIEYGVYS